jgi:hypothetical protein
MRNLGMAPNQPAISMPARSINGSTFTDSGRRVDAIGFGRRFVPGVRRPRSPDRRCGAAVSPRCACGDRRGETATWTTSLPGVEALQAHYAVDGFTWFGSCLGAGGGCLWLQQKLAARR